MSLTHVSFVVASLRFQAANGKGGMSDKMATWLLFDAFIPTFEDTPSLNEEFTVLEEPAWRCDKDNPFRRSNFADDVLCKGNVEKRGPGTTRLRAPVIVCDGHSSHLTVELLEAMADMQQFAILDGKKCTGKIKRMSLILRVPHSSHATQGERPTP